MGDGTQVVFDDVRVDISQIPKHQQEALAAAALDSLNRTLRKPNGREILDRIIAEYGL